MSVKAEHQSKNCEECGQLFTPPKPYLFKSQRFCSSICRINGMRGEKNTRWKDPDHTCLFCGKIYKSSTIAGRNKSQHGVKYCSWACYKASGEFWEHHKLALTAAIASNKSTPARGKYWKRKGNTREFKAMDILEAEGFHTIRASGSHGMFDIVAWDVSRFRYIQVKSTRISPAEKEAIRTYVHLPPNATKEIWIFKNYARSPMVLICNGDLEWVVS